MKRVVRPVNVGLANLLAFSWPLAAVASITHRVTGALLFVGLGLGLYLLDLSLAGQAGFAQAQALLAAPLGAFVAWACLSALAFHLVAGVKHLLMDLGLGESLAGARWAAVLTFLASAGLAALAAAWLFGVNPAWTPL